MTFYGMSSRKALDRYSGGRRDYRACEGREIKVPYKGPVKDTIQEITGGIRSACAYVGRHPSERSLEMHHVRDLRSNDWQGLSIPCHCHYC